MKLTIFTATRPGPIGPWFNAMAQSVQENQPRDSVHHLQRVDGPQALEQARWKSLSQADTEFVAWVDDDDLLYPNALKRCIDALDDTAAALAFTDEQLIDAHANPIAVNDGERTTRDVAMHPGSIHHLSVFRADVFKNIEPLTNISQGVAIDWVCRAYAALKHGAVHVPMIGYGWRHHKDNYSSGDEFNRIYSGHLDELRRITRGWMGLEDRPIPRYLS